MRKIKFRAKDSHRDKFVYGDLILKCSVPHIITYPGICVGINVSTVGQFTGLKDKNGKEIYEGDIVKRENRLIGYILFLPQESGFVIVTKNNDERFGHRYGDGGYKMLNFEIVGNIYDNKELLDKEK